MPNKFKKKYFYQIIKRAFDLLVSLLLILLLLPLFILISILIMITTKSGPIYFDQRLGKNRKPIKIAKFRSMKKDDRPIEEILSKEEYKEYLKAYKLDNDPRITKIGKLLRKSSIDELPQLFNILLGQMSFVGPRPIKDKEYELLWDGHDDIFLVKPGLTGYWGANGRSNVTYDKRVTMEVYYVYHRSLWLDMAIFFKTFIAVIFNKGAK